MGDRGEAKPSEPSSVGETELIRWWRPGWRSAFTYLGYHWLALLILLSVLAVTPLLALFAGLEIALVLLFIKLAVLFGGGAVAVGLHVGRAAVRYRCEPFCIFCGYSLRGLPDEHRCPECGRPYTFAMVDEYRRDPAWFIYRWKMRNELPPDGPKLKVPTDAPLRTSRDGT